MIRFFTLFSKYPNINFTIYTSTISKQLKLDFEKYSKQYKNISLKTFKSSHDRFLIIDKKEIYHFGASLKDLGKKWFAFSKMNLNSLNLEVGHLCFSTLFEKVPLPKHLKYKNQI
jgi:hypothetical protein